MVVTTTRWLSYLMPELLLYLAEQMVLWNNKGEQFTLILSFLSFKTLFNMNANIGNYHLHRSDRRAALFSHHRRLLCKPAPIHCSLCISLDFPPSNIDCLISLHAFRCSFHTYRPWQHRRLYSRELCHFDCQPVVATKWYKSTWSLKHHTLDFLVDLMELKCK